MIKLGGLLFLFAAATWARAEDPEVKMGPLELIHHWGYTGEEHLVRTADGYNLGVYRIPYGRQGSRGAKRPVLFLQHGLECSCTNWLTNFPNQSAAYIFADAGFDVWMGNFRGNTYSSHRLNPNMSKAEFWDFSWDEMAAYDLPAMIDYALDKSGAESLYYVGHSQGTMAPFALLSIRPDYGVKIKKLFALGPVASVHHIGGFLGAVRVLEGPLGRILQLFGVHEFLPSNWLLHEVDRLICENKVLNPIVCGNVLFLIAGPDTGQMNQSRIPVYFGHTPAGTSTKNMIHFIQGTKTDKFQKYDYGILGNIVHYHCTKPPEYDLTRIRNELYLYVGEKDVLADPTDVRNVIIPKIPHIVEANFLDFNHLDFIWGLNAPSKVYLPIIRTIRNAGENVTIPHN